MAAEVIRDCLVVQGTVYGLQGPVVFLAISLPLSGPLCHHLYGEGID